MESDNSVMLCALKFLCGADENVCRLCLCSIQEKTICIDDNVTLERPYYEETVRYFDIFTELGVSTDQSLPDKLCRTCADVVTSTYLFARLYEYSTRTWEKVLERLSSSLNQMDTIGSSVKAAYFLVGESNNIMYTSRKNHSSKNKEDVLENINKTIHSKKNQLAKRKKKVKCGECGKLFSSKVMLSKHDVRVHNKTHNACALCPKVFASPMQLEDHAERVHYPKKLQCPKCDKMFSTEKMLKVHIKFNHTTADCKLCFMKFPSKKILRRHLDKHELFKCLRCSKVLSNKHTYKAHLKLCGNAEEKTQKFFCDICGKGYVRKNGIRSHVKTDHGFGKVISCQWCGKLFDAVSKLKNHVVKHTKEKNFHCEHCGNRFVTQAALIYHVRLHTGERPFPCELCDESFLSASRRMEHKRSKHFGPTKQCPVCPMKFVTGNQLKKHVRRHFDPHSKLYCPSTVLL